MSKAIEAAARRVVSSNLERARTYKKYRDAIKDAKDSKELEHDAVFRQLRDDMQLARDNNESAQQSYEAICAFPPIEP